MCPSEILIKYNYQTLYKWKIRIMIWWSYTELSGVINNFNPGIWHLLLYTFTVYPNINQKPNKYLNIHILLNINNYNLTIFLNLVHQGKQNIARFFHFITVTKYS